MGRLGARRSNLGQYSDSSVRTALCLSGQPRCIERCIDSLKRRMIDPLKCDVFVHFWISSWVPPFLSIARYNNNAHTWKRFCGDHALRMLNILKPVMFAVQPQVIFDEAKYASQCTMANSRMQAVSFTNVLSMYYSIREANNLKCQYEDINNFKYDCVIRCRPDLEFHEPIDENLLLDLSKIYIPRENGYGGYNDQFAFSSSANMDKYSECYDFIAVHFDKGGNFHPETILKKHLEDRNIIVKGTDSYFTLQR
jgi:hypothetical protein